jgi:Alr-MurF fusion protein
LQVFEKQNVRPSALRILTDSRRVNLPGQSIFFALQGTYQDGHRFIDELYDRGVREFVVTVAYFTQQNKILEKKYPQGIFWIVEDTLAAMQEMTAHHRRQFELPVVAITGSNAKTIVKEWLATLLGQRFRIAKSPKSYNSQLGVPLSVWQLNAQHNAAIFEAGISRPGEMINLEKIIQPTWGIFTNIGPAHGEFFENNQHKIREKLALFAHAQQLIYCSDYVEIEEEIQQFFRRKNPNCQLISWARINEAKYRVDWQNEGYQTQVSMEKEDEKIQFEVPFIDEASIENALHCAVLMWEWGCSEWEIKQRLAQLKPLSMRLELKQGIHRSQVVDDTYNNDLAGLTMALDFLNLQKQQARKLLILSDLLESGLPEAQLYEQIAQLIQSKKINQLIAIGHTFYKYRDLFPKNTRFWGTTDDFLAHEADTIVQDAMVLVKGARKFGFERIVAKFQQKTHGTVLEVNLDALLHNLNFYRQKIGPDTRIMGMVKALAYGAGSAEVAALLQYQGIDYLAVAYADEGRVLREQGIYVPIMVMNPQPEDFQQLIDYQLEPEMYSIRILREWAEFVDRQQLTAKIHLKFDTGMHRLGFENKDLEALFDLLRHHPNLLVASAFTHLSAADDPQWDTFTQHQLTTFAQMAKRLSHRIGYTPLRHALNSAGIARFASHKMDMVRLGVGLYGLAAQPGDQLYLQTVGTLKTIISQIKEVPAGESVGYGRQGISDHDRRIATIAIGYADGYDRRFGRGVGQVWVAGVRCAVVGNVCMDMTMIDITAVPYAREGDSVVVFGQPLPIWELAQWIGTIPYEILTNVSGRVKRVFFKE